ncbi:MAG: LON peptidase substrate-binding domain-containing protein, partial [Pseudomonadota bacterium]
MGKNVDLPGTIPVFPLPGALLLPRARLPLHIFEPRYLQMLDDALKTPARLIGMIQPNEVPGRSGNGLHSIGCAGRVTQFSETEDNRYLITLTGMSRFRVQSEVSGFTPYRRCDVSWDGFERDLGNSEADTGFRRSGFLDLLGRYFETKSLSADWDTLKEADDELLINSLSMM